MFPGYNIPTKLQEKNIFSKICGSQSDVTIIEEPQLALSCWHSTNLDGCGSTRNFNISISG